jgi:hypothetical protein
MPRDHQAPGWEHAVLYALDARAGVEVARRVLPDPVPVAAMVVEAGALHVVATRKGEPIFWYSLAPASLVPKHRRIVRLANGGHDDVLDAWAAPDGGLWLELDAATGADGHHALAYTFAEPEGTSPATCLHGDDVIAEGPFLARDACAGGHELFAPVEGRWGGSQEVASPPALTRLDPLGTATDAQPIWIRASVVGPRAKIHALGADGVVYAVAVAEEPGRPERVSVEALAVDRTSGVVRWSAKPSRIAVRARMGDSARIARRPNGELLFQSLGVDGAPCTPLVCARPDGRLDTILLGARGRWVLDAALGDSVLAHREDKDGVVEVGGFAVDLEGRLLGRRAATRWTIETGSLGGETTVYAGAGAVVVRGARSLCAIRL